MWGENSSGYCVHKKISVSLQVFWGQPKNKDAMAEMIRHDGRVIAVNGDEVRVQIVQASACAACKAQKMCMSAESKTKEMVVQPLEPLAVGDEVEVMIYPRLGWKAILIAYILPFVVLVGTVFVLNRWLSEAAAGTIALCAIGVYYLGLSFFKGKLQREFQFTARKKA